MNLNSKHLKVLSSVFYEGGNNTLPPVFENMSKIIEFLDSLSPQPNELVCTTALFVALLDTDRTKQAVKSIGGNEDLIPNLNMDSWLQPTELVKHMEKGSDYAVVAGSLFVAWYLNAIRQDDTTRAKSLLSSLKLLIEHKKTCQIVASSALKCMQSISFNETNDKEEVKEKLFSISIDLAGSTQAKTDLMTAYPNDQRRIDEHNLEIMRKFLALEMGFYKDACSVHASYRISPDKLFTVKGIGDEVWTLANPEEDNAVDAGLALINSGLITASKGFNVIATENEEGMSFDPSFDYGKVKVAALGIKIFIDTVDNATDIGEIRFKEVNKFSHDALKEDSKAEPNEKDRVDVLNKLLFGGYEPAGWIGFHRIRTDYIGHDIDRFFRISGKATPGFVAIGESMSTFLKLKFEEVGFHQESLFKVVLEGGSPFKGGLSKDSVYAIKDIIEAKDLKGIGYDYTIYRLFSPRSLNGMLHQEEADKKNGFKTFSYDKVRETLPYDILQRLVDLELASSNQ